MRVGVDVDAMTHVKLFLTEVKEYSLEIVVFFVLSTVFYFGCNDLPFVKEKVASALAVAGALSGSLLYIWSIVTSRKRRLENAILIAASSDDDFLFRLRDCSPDTFNLNRNLAFALALEKWGCLNDFKQTRDEIYPGMRSISSMFDTTGVADVRALIEQVEFSRLYKDLEKMDRIMRSVLPERLQTSFPRECYFIRLNHLDQFAVTLFTQRDFELGACDRNLEPIQECRRQALHLFFKGTEKSSRYPPSTNLSERDLEVAISTDVRRK